jgi:proline racemase
MDFSKIASAIRDKHDGRITTIDSHTAGEATRLVVDGYEPIPGATMREKRENFMRERDHLRLLLTREPRGHRDLPAAVLTEPCTPGADFGLIYMDAKRYPYLCGHATIGAVTSLIEAGLLEAEPESKVVVDTPSGPMETVALAPEGRVRSVAFRSVPAFVQDTGLPLNVPGYGALTIDLVYAGGFFAMIEASESRLEPTAVNSKILVPLGMQIIEAANNHFDVSHPERPEVDTVDVAEFHKEEGPGRGRGLVVYGEGHMDRSPCGTGTTAKLALLHAKGSLARDERYVNVSPLGTEFSARISDVVEVGGRPAIIAEIAGSAYLTGVHEFILDELDPFPEGYLP